MIYLCSIICFRREKYRFVLVMISFSAFHFCTIIYSSLYIEPIFPVKYILCFSLVIGSALKAVAQRV